MISRKNSTIIAKEGQLVVGVICAILIICYLFDFVLFFYIALVSFIGSIYVYRNGERVLDDCSKDTIATPIDGIVSEIVSCDDSVKIKIKNRLFDSHILRAPIRGEITSTLVNGANINLNLEKSETLNSRSLVSIVSKDRRVDILLRGSVFKNSIHLYSNRDGLEIFKNIRFGFMLCGEVILTLPKNTRLKINIGDRVASGQDVLGYTS